MLHRDYPGQTCSVARTLEAVGERWTLLILRDCFLGLKRFEEFRDSLGIARNVLAARLEELVREGVLERRRYQERPERFEYVLTEKGRDLWPVTVALLKWGDRYHEPEAGRPLILEHAGCGGEVDDRRGCGRCGQALEARDVRAVRGPGAPPTLGGGSPAHAVEPLAPNP